MPILARNTSMPTAEPGAYDFTPPFDASPLGPIELFPGLGRFKPFLIGLARHRLDGRGPLRSPRYAKDVALLESLGHRKSKARTPDQLVQQRDPSPWQAARVLAWVNFAMMDAGIASSGPNHSRFWRPYTAIRHAAEDGDDATQGDPNWHPCTGRRRQ